MRKLLYAVLIISFSTGCVPKKGGSSVTPSTIDNPGFVTTLIPGPTQTELSSIEDDPNTLLPTAVPSLPPGVYPITFTDNGFHVKTLAGDDLAVVQTQGTVPGEASPDGRFIVVTQPSVELINLEFGTSEILPEVLPGFHPTWSPDGAQLVYTSVNDGHDFGSLFLLNLEDGSTQRLTHTKGFEIEPSWSPDGKWIAFASDAGNRSLGNTELYVFDVSCIKTGSCDDDATRLQALPEGNWDSSPSWSPASNQLVYFCSSPDGTNICKYDIATSSISVLVKSVAGYSGPKYSPDGEWIGYTRENSSNGQVRPFIFNLSTNEERSLSSGDLQEQFSTWILVQ
jgi:Tol biopolymer transport system component